MGTSCLFILVFLVTASVAVPLKSSHVRAKREEENVVFNRTVELNGCVLDNIEYKPGDEVPSLGPCERCVCIAPDVECSMVKCQPNSGCRIIQQSGQCCPEYKCDCEYNGRVYNNGERLDKPEDPCQVCYCKGGEIMCTSITCYERDDCKPHFSPGQCCPRYDHCPVETSRVSVNSVRSVNASLYSPKREMQPWPLTKPSNMPSSVNYDESNVSHNNVYPQTIKIVEILPTTPGYANKQGEVSVIPRVKTNEQEETKDREMESVEEDTSPPSSTADTFDSSTTFSSSTSEIEHLLDTTPEPDIKNGGERIETVPERTVSTLNPLSEEISETNGLLTQPDSQKLATIYPSYYHTNGELNNLEQGTTDESTTPVEGSGYELLTGGIYEDDSSSESPLVHEMIGTTEQFSSEETKKPFEDNLNITHDLPKFEAYTATESYNSRENESSLIGTFETNDTSSEVFESSNESTGVNSEQRSALSKSSEDSDSSESDSEENSFNTTSSDGENTTQGLESTTDNQYSTVPVHLRNSELNLSTNYYEDQTENNSESMYDKLTFTTNEPNKSEDTSENYYSSEGPLNSSGNISHFEATSSSLNSIEEENETSTPLHEASEINYSTTEYDSSPSSLLPQGRKKMSRLNYRNLESELKNSATPATLTFPSVLNVHTLEYNQMNPQTESIQQENVTSMAKVGIYHPAKPNELAGYLTVVDDKTNVTTQDGKIISSHILLTPNDLKKLAEILIHEKIKPAYLDDVNERNANPEISYDSLESSTSSQVSENENSRDDSGSSIATEYETDKTILQESLDDTSNSTVIVGNEKQLSEENFSSHGSTEAEDNVENEYNSGSTISQNTVTKKLVSSTSSTKPLNDNYPEDPNTSRQIRIPDNASHQYSALLDDRDLLILDNFFRKNMGLQ